MTFMRTIWEILWDYDPNALVVTDEGFKIRIVNPAFRKLFKLNEDEQIVGKHLSEIFQDIKLFEKVRDENIVIKNQRMYFPTYDLNVNAVVFPIPETKMIAAILIDITSEIKREKKSLELKMRATEQVQAVVDKQMQIAQEIASILGETVAETKAQLIKLRDLITRE
ncbi:MAG: PAS domain-containing protein [Thermotogaceae bacterium]|nr:PAS domain-containing protein [Thermotogaceae bacterium]